MLQHQISDIFKHVLAINTQSIKLLPISHTIHLISFNAQIAAAHVGERGKALSALTYEINTLSPKISEHILDITKTVHEIARHNASCMNQVGKLHRFSNAITRMDKIDTDKHSMTQSSETLQDVLEKSYKQLIDKLNILRPILADVEQQIKSAEVVGMLLRIEVARGATTGADTGAFTALADELFASCATMKEIAKQCQQTLEQAKLLAENPEKIKAETV